MITRELASGEHRLRITVGPMGPAYDEGVERLRFEYELGYTTTWDSGYLAITHGNTDLWSGVNAPDTAEELGKAFNTLLSFLEACAESIQYSNNGDDNTDLFPEALHPVIEMFSNEFYMARTDLGEDN